MDWLPYGQFLPREAEHPIGELEYHVGAVSDRRAVYGNSSCVFWMLQRLGYIETQTSLFPDINIPSNHAWH
jgi:hypothetical protein